MKKLLVILDNGHGTRQFTKGKCSPDKRIYEGEWNREFVSLLSYRLKANNIEYKVLVPENEDISLVERVKRANKITSEYKKLGYEVLIISIHINAAKSDGKYHNARGFTSWIYTNASSKSKKFASIISELAYFKFNLKGNRSIPPEMYYTANFYIVKNTNAPCVLCENLFMDNLQDEEYLLSIEGKEVLLKLYTNSILKYINY